jgi:uncharacterized protein (DUF4415 family)
MAQKKPPRDFVTVGGRRYSLPSPREDAALIAAAQSDVDNPPLTDKELGELAPARRRGRPPKAEPKVVLTLRLDPDIVAHFKADGAGWHTRMNAALRAAMASSGRPSVRRTAAPLVKKGRKLSLKGKKFGGRRAAPKPQRRNRAGTKSVTA